LSQIAIVSEGARRSGLRETGASEVLGDIADTARSLVESMSDIVWAIDPEHDQLRDLTSRMRRFCEDVCGAAGIELSFQAPEADYTSPADAHLRRQVYLVCKEGVNNAIRHSGCTSISVCLWLQRGALLLQVVDNGRGFQRRGSIGGNGLRSIEERARRLGGRVSWESGGTGTSMLLRIPARAGSHGLPRPHKHAMRARAGSDRVE
jgi:signal transduction histidine kinase